MAPSDYSSTLPTFHNSNGSNGPWSKRRLNRQQQLTTQSARTLSSTKTTQSPKTRGPSETNIATANTKPKEEIHLRLGEKILTNCFVRYASNERQTSFFRRRLDASQFYTELYALKGSVMAESTVDTEHLRNTSRMLNTNLGCSEIGSGKKYCCAVRVRVPRRRYIAVLLYENDGLTLKISDSRQTYFSSNEFKVDTGSMDGTLIFISGSNIVNIVLIWKKVHRYIHGRVFLRFQVVDDPDLQVRHTAFNRGTVETPLYYERSILLTRVSESFTSVEVPVGYQVMISSTMFGVMEFCVELSDGNRGNTKLLKVCPTSRNKHLHVYNTTLLLIRISYKVKYIKNRRFRLYFSFFSAKQPRPAKLADGSWNCSVPYKRELLHHLTCNKVVDCHGVEDERDCPYTTDVCGPGYLTLGGSCFFYLRSTEREITSRDAAQLCSRRTGGGLATLGTREKWEDLSRFLGRADVFLGLRTARRTLPLWYAETFFWTGHVTAFYLVYKVYSITDYLCNRQRGVLRYYDSTTLGSYMLMKDHDYEKDANILCEKTTPSQRTQKVIPVNSTLRWPRNMTAAYVECPLGHSTHRFLACDVRSSCWSRDHSDCRWSQEPLPPSFLCSNRIERVPYTLMCDHRDDCRDSSDEDFCTYPECSGEQFACDDGQCIPSTKICDSWGDCEQYEDERYCHRSYGHLEPVGPLPYIVSISNKGTLVARAAGRNGTCPHTHFWCPDKDYCLPIFLRCNGVLDCPGHEDETGCQSCPGLYRCRGSPVCLAHSHLCDGHPLCPRQDDELLCDLTCPSSCVCRGLAFFCGHPFPASAFPSLRFVDASSSFVAPAHLKDNLLLIHLNLAHCGLSRFDNISLPNLLILNVRGNRLTTLSHLNLTGIPNLRELLVADNPLKLEFEGGGGHSSFGHVLTLDLSRVVLTVLNTSALSSFPNVQVLNLSHSAVQRVLEEGFRNLKQLRVLDLRGCPMTWFPREIFQHLHHLQTVRARNFKMCCPEVLPLYFKLSNCFAPSNAISSCDNLLREYGYRVCAFLLSAVALAGNAVSFIFRTYKSKEEKKPGYVNFVTHLSISDFIMGVYLAVIGVADYVFHGTYLWNDVAWRQGVACHFAGFLCMLSSEVSALIVCFITLDRFLVLRFPFSQLHFTNVSSHIAAGVVWMGGVTLASVPLLPGTRHWDFYSQTGICIPLPTTRTDFPGYSYSFCVFVVFNCFVFVAISVGQVSIYWSVRANSVSASSTSKKRKDLTIARRLITVALTDFVCWFPVCVLGLMATGGVPVSGEVDVAVAIFVLPLNAAINPYLYTFNVIKERRARAMEENLRKILIAQLKPHN